MSKSCPDCGSHFGREHERHTVSCPRVSEKSNLGKVNLYEIATPKNAVNLNDYRR